MITFIKGMLVGMALAVIIQIAVDQLKGKALKPKREMFVDGVIEDESETELTAEEKFNKLAEEINDMAHIDSIIEFCKESEFYGDV